MKRIEHRVIEGAMECLSGCRIGGSDDVLQIGGTDLTCIKHPVTKKPYLPGSSIKGKLRSELEKMKGITGTEPCGCARPDCLVCRLFGPHKNTKHELGPTRIVVRDADLIQGGELEVKTENVIDRKIGTALHPRSVERVASGAVFHLSIGIQIWDIDNDCEYRNLKGADALVKYIRDGLQLIERTGIGAGVSKGYGRVKFTLEPTKRLNLPDSLIDTTEELG